MTGIARGSAMGRDGSAFRVGSLVSMGLIVSPDPSSIHALGGAPRHPVWYYNLKAQSHVELQDGPIKRDYQAREVTGDEKVLWWERAVEAWPDYARYQTKTARQIPVFVLEPI